MEIIKNYASVCLFQVAASKGIDAMIEDIIRAGLGYLKIDFKSAADLED